jgi:NAD(P)H-flavin reductase
MNWIVARKRLSENIVKIDISAPEIASASKPGNHVIIKLSDNSEPLPMVISRVNKQRGIISLYIHTLGTLQQKLAGMAVGDELFELNGPCGNSIDAEKVGTVVCAAGGVGIAPLFPIVAAMKEAGNRVIVVLGARSSNYLILEDEMLRIADELIVMTDDGSRGREGMVTEGMHEVFTREKVDLVVTYGPVKMIKHSSTLTHMFNIPIIANLYSMNLDGNGNNGIYRVSVCANSNYVSVDGIDFHAFYPNFDTMMKRMEGRLNDGYAGNQSYSKLQVEQY